MANDYFQDITPPDDSAKRPTPPPAPKSPTPPPPEVHLDEPEPSTDGPQDVPIRIDAGKPTTAAVAAGQGIRSITPPRMARPRIGGDMREAPSAPPLGSRFRPEGSRLWLWIAAAIAVVVVAILLLLAFRPTTVTVAPRSHTIVLDNATAFTAYPSSSAASGTLAYTLKTVDLEDSQVVPATGAVNTPAHKASGSITVYNSFSTTPVKLIKTTRFATPDGLIFRVPADISVPGMKGSTPGSVTVTVVADQNGAEYNVGPDAKFTLPGLKNNAAMYAGVYAKSTAAMTGGSSGGSGPGVDPTALTAAVSALKASLLTKAQEAASGQAGEGEIVLPDLVQVTYSTQPNTAEAGGGARVHESAHVAVPVFKTMELGRIVGSAVAADSDNALIEIVPGTGFAAKMTNTSADLSQGPLQFTLAGQADLIWNIDVPALQEALAGRDQGAFQTVIAGFPGIEEAHAKIEPFWNGSFPKDSSKIKVVMLPPKESQQSQ